MTARRAAIAAGGITVALVLAAGLVALFPRDMVSQSPLERTFHEYAGYFGQAVGPVFGSAWLLVGVVIFAVSQVMWWLRSARPPGERLIRLALHGLLFVYGAVVLALTTLPVTFGSWSWAQLEYLIPGRAISDYVGAARDGGGLTSMVRDLAGNVVAFVPAGVLLPLGWARFRSFFRTVLAVGAAAGAIEAIQLFTDAVPTFDDVALNVTGAAIGYGFYRSAQGLVGSSARLSQAPGGGDGRAPVRVPGH